MKTQIEITMGNDECFPYMYKQMKALFGEKVHVFIMGSWIDKYKELNEVLSWNRVSVERNTFILYYTWLDYNTGEVMVDKGKTLTEFPYRYQNLSSDSRIMIRVDG